MLYKFVYIVLLIIWFTFSGKIIEAQELDASATLESSTIITITNSQKVDDGIVIFGYYRGTLNSTPSYTSDLFDMFLAKYDDDFNLLWINSIGGSSIDLSYDLKVSSDGSIYIAGSFREKCGFSDSDTLISDGLYDSFLANYSSEGNLNWAKKIASNPANQYGTSIDIEENGNIIYGGYYKDSIDLISDKYNNTNGLYLVRLDNNGDLLWSKDIKTESLSSRITTIRAFSDGYYINGDLQGTVYFDTGDEISENLSNTDVFLYKINYDGVGQWHRRAYSVGEVKTGDIAQDNYGNIYYTGYFEDEDIYVDSTEFEQSELILNKGSKDIFIFKYNKNGNLIWGKGYGGDGEERAYGLDSNDDLFYFTGYFSDTIIFDRDTLVSASISINDILIGVIDSDGNTIKAKSIYGNDYDDSGTSVSVLTNNSVYLGGFFKSTTVDVGGTVYTNTNPGKSVLLIARYKPDLTAVYTDITEISCNGQTDGELTIKPYFGTAPYTYSWSHNGTLNDSIATSLGAGTYRVTVTDSNLDTDEITYTLVEPDPISFNPVITNIIACSYSEDGAIDLNMAGGTGSFTYQWQASDGGYGAVFSVEDQSNLTIGTYAVIVTDANECVADTTIILTGPDPITFDGTIVTDSSSLGAGDINLEIQGGTGVPSYNWDYPTGGTASTQDITNLNTGNYTVTVTDGNLCEFDTLINVKNLDDFYIYIIDFNDACKGTINGRAKVSHSPLSSTNITYQWDDAANQTTAEATNLAPGRYYHVTVTEVDLSKVRVDSVYIDELTYDFSGSWSGSSILNCFGDTDGYIDLSITAPGGELPYSYNWSTGSNVQDVSSIGVGNYSVTVTDDNSCSFSLTNFAVTQPAVLSVVAEIVKEPSCNGDFNGKINVVRAGGTSPYTQQWDDPGFQNTQVADGLDAGFYNVTVTDNNSCMVNSSVDLTEPDEISVTKLVSNETCNTSDDGFINLTVSGGTSPFSYFWDTSSGSGLNVTSKDQSGLTAGKYYFTITDDNNCYYEDSVEITQPTLLEITNEVKTDVIACNGDNTGSITISASGGTGLLTYTLNPGALQTNNTGIFNGLGAGTYTAYVEDASSCNVTSSSIEITQPVALALSTDTEIDAKCKGINNGSVTISVSGGTIASAYAYNWTTTDGSGIISGDEDQPNLGAGTYNITVTDDNSCEISSSYILTEPDTIAVSKTKFDLVCYGESDGGVNISVSGGVSPYSYEWSTTDGSGVSVPDKNQTGLTVGKYNVTVTDDNSCKFEDSVEILEPTLLEITLEEAINGTSCGGGSTGAINISATGGTGGLTYTLNPGAVQTNSTGNFTGIGTGTYIVEVEDDNACTVSSSSLIVTEPEAIVITTDNQSNVTCYGSENGSVEITVTGGTVSSDYTYIWSTDDGLGLVGGNQDQLALGVGTYYLTVTDDNSCEVTTSYALTEPSPVEISKSVYNAFCTGTNDGVIVLTITGGALPFSYFWTTIDGSGLVATNKHQSGLSAAMYYIRVDDANGCIFNDSVEIIDPPEISITSENSTDATDNNSRDGSVTVEATGGTPPLTYTLNPTDELNYTGIFDDLNPGEYTVEVSDFNDCGPVESITLTVGAINSIYDILLGENILIYPNPTSSILFIDFDNMDDAFSVQIINISGQVVYTDELESSQMEVPSIDMSNYSNGFYFIRIYNSKGSYQEKILLQ
jgi:hypothetical protein